MKHPESFYRDLGIHYFDQRDRAIVERRAIKRLEGLGYEVVLKPTDIQKVA